jgi:hypothetical protein
MRVAVEQSRIYLPLIGKTIRGVRRSFDRENSERDISSRAHDLALGLRNNDDLIFAVLQAATSAEAGDEGYERGEHDDP